MSRRGMFKLTTAGMVLLSCAMVPAKADERRVAILPYVGVDQMVSTPIKGRDDTLTFTNVTAGVSGHVQTRRVEANIDVQYMHSFSWNKRFPDQDVLSGIVDTRIKITRNLVFDAGGLATRVRSDGLSGARVFANDGHTSQVYAGSIGPTYTNRLGDWDVRAAYRLGYARVDDQQSAFSLNSAYLNNSTESWSHSLQGSVGFEPDTVLPGVGLTATTGYSLENSKRMDQRFENGWGRLEAVVPVSSTLALLGSVGYEKIEISQRPVLRDGGGFPVIDNGHFVTDKSAPRTLTYDQDGFIWDVGVLWRPSQRMTATARFGERYGGTTFSGSLNWQGRESNVSIVIFDGIDNFGRQITSNIDALSGNGLNVGRNPFSGDLLGCAFSPSGGGQCFNDALAGITGANYRNRGVNAQYARRHGPWAWGLGAGYSQRKFITPSNEAVLIRGSKEQNWFANASADYVIGQGERIGTMVYVNYFDATGGRYDVLNIGGSVNYQRRLAHRLNGTAAVGVDSVKADDIETITAMGLVGLRYSF